MKKSIILLTIFVLMIFMTSCVNSLENDETNNYSDESEIYVGETNNYGDESKIYGGETPPCYTLSEYLNSGKTLILYNSTTNGSTPSDGIIKKDTYPDYIYIFKDNLLSVYYMYHFSYGEIAKMTDDEVIAFCEQSCIRKKANIQCQFYVYTDGTGNNTDYEEIIFGEEISLNRYQTFDNITLHNSDVNASATVYDSTFFKLPKLSETERDGYWYRFNDEYYLSLDTPDSNNVAVDP